MKYCYNCNTSRFDNDCKWRLVHKGNTTGRSEDQHPDEYEGPLCPLCEAYVYDYVCETCNNDNSDLVEIEGHLFCPDCIAGNQLQEIVDKLKKIFSFDDFDALEIIADAVQKAKAVTNA